jgi:hypothetical protein
LLFAPLINTLPQGFEGLRTSEIDRDFPRIEKAFQKYIGGSSLLEEKEPEHAKAREREADGTRHAKKAGGLDHHHEYEIVVGE